MTGPNLGAIHSFPLMRHLNLILQINGLSPTNRNQSHSWLFAFNIISMFNNVPLA